MAVVSIPKSSGRGPWWTDSQTSPTVIYFYPACCVEYTQAEGALDFGYKKHSDGSINDGIITDWLQALGASVNGVNLNSVAFEEDTDSTSPNHGRLRLKFTLAATVA